MFDRKAYKTKGKKNFKGNYFLYFVVTLIIALLCDGLLSSVVGHVNLANNIMVVSENIPQLAADSSVLAESVIHTVDDTKSIVETISEIPENAMEEFRAQITEIIAEAIARISDVAEAAVESGRKFVETEAQTVLDGAEKIKEHVDSAGEKSGELVNDTAATLQEGLAQATSEAADAAQKGSELISNTADALIDGVTEAEDTFENADIEDVENIPDAISLGVEQISEAVGEAGDMLADTADNVGGIVSESAEGAGEVLSNSAEDAGGIVGEAVNNIAETVSETATQLEKNAEDFTSGAISALENGLSADTEDQDDLYAENHPDLTRAEKMADNITKAYSAATNIVKTIDNIEFPEEHNIKINGILKLALAVLVFSIFKIGGCSFFVRKSEGCGKFSDLFSGFSGGDYVDNVLLMLLLKVKTLLWTLLFVIPGIIKRYEYSMVPYIAAEKPDIGQGATFALSRKLTKGYKWKLFVFDLSFIGWDILNLLTLDLLGIFYVNPYKKASWAEVYIALKKISAEKKVSVQSEESGIQDNEDALLSGAQSEHISGGACLNSKDISDVWEP